MTEFINKYHKPLAALSVILAVVLLFLVPTDDSASWYTEMLVTKSLSALFFYLTHKLLPNPYD